MASRSFRFLQSGPGLALVLKVSETAVGRGLVQPKESRSRPKAQRKTKSRSQTMRIRAIAATPSLYREYFVHRAA